MQKFEIYRKSIDIDYYVYFTKAYFAFNAYLKYKYPDEDDIGKIKKIKGESSIKRIFERLVEEGKHFKDDVKSLQISLNNAQIKNKGEYILFSKVKINEHEAKILFCAPFRTKHYDIRSLNGEKFTFNVDTITPNPNVFKFGEIEDILSNSALSQTQKNKITDVITNYVVSYNVDLTNDIEKLMVYNDLSRSEQQELIDRLYKGFIVIIYNLRNALFHSEVEPNANVMRVYKFVYFILRKFIKEIPTN